MPSYAKISKAVQSDLDCKVEQDPRENGSLCAKLQFAEELVSSLRSRICRLADNIQGMGQDWAAPEPDEAHMNLLRFPDEIIADAKASNSALNRIEGALGI